MKVYKLKPREEILNSRPNPWYPPWDRAFGFVVVANDEAKARELATGAVGDEGEEVWLDSKYSTCIEVSTDTARIVCRDFNAG